MDGSGDDSGEDEANDLLDETLRLRRKRDLLCKENEELKTYLRLRQMESTSTCEQLKSEIEQQIEQFEALGDTQTNHLETLKSFRSEIEAIQCWNAKIRNKYFSRNSEPNIADQLTDELIDEMVGAGGSQQASDGDGETTDGKSDAKKSSKSKTTSKRKDSQIVVNDLDINRDNDNSMITRSKQKSLNTKNKRKQIEVKTEDKTQKMTKRKKK